MDDRITLESGRTVGLHRLGGGFRTVVLCHAAPGSGVFDPDPEATATRGVTILALDRPGYGVSDPPSDGDWATVSGAADDLAEVLRALGTGPVGIAGWSAGGRVALALAARHRALVSRVCVIATPAPDEAVPWVPPPQAAALEAMRGWAPQTVHVALAAQLASMLPADPRDPAALGIIGATAADDETLHQPGARDRLATMLAVAFAQGAAGMAADIAGYTLRPWGFELDEVAAKTLLLFGAKDPVAASRHGRWWQRQLPDARLEMVPDAGHLVIIPMWKRVLSFLTAA